MKTTLRSIALGLLCALGLGASGGLLAGCSTPGGTVCERWCGCEGCTKTEREDCEANFALGAERSSDNDCTEDYDAFVVCLENRMECRANRVDIRACGVEEHAARKCAGGACRVFELNWRMCCARLEPSMQADCHAYFEGTVGGGTEEICAAANESFSCPVL